MRIRGAGPGRGWRVDGVLPPPICCDDEQTLDYNEQDEGESDKGDLNGMLLRFYSFPSGHLSSPLKRRYEYDGRSSQTRTDDLSIGASRKRRLVKEFRM